MLNVLVSFHKIPLGWWTASCLSEKRSIHLSHILCGTKSPNNHLISSNNTSKVHNCLQGPWHIFHGVHVSNKTPHRKSTRVIYLRVSIQMHECSASTLPFCYTASLNHKSTPREGHPRRKSFDGIKWSLVVLLSIWMKEQILTNCNWRQYHCTSRKSTTQKYGQWPPRKNSEGSTAERISYDKYLLQQYVNCKLWIVMIQNN